MPRPRYKIRPEDWFDALDWVEYQLSQPDWLTDPEHPVHNLGLASLTERLQQLRFVEVPTHPDCQLLQRYLDECLPRHDWDKLRKSLSARRRRRRERRTRQTPVNLTLTPEAHFWLKQLVKAGQFTTLSDALEKTLPDAVADLESQAREARYQALEERLNSLDSATLCQAIEFYLSQAASQRSLATACRIAYQWYLGGADEHKEKLLRERFIEDLVWNESHLGWSIDDFLEQLKIIQA